MTKGEIKTNRIFRADMPHDIFCATIVAEKLPQGNDILVINPDYGDGSPEFMESMMMASSVYEWKAIVNTQGLSVNQHYKGRNTLYGRVLRIFETLESIKQLRKLLAPNVGLSPTSNKIKIELDKAVTEIYTNNLNKPEVLAFYKIFPSASFIYYPHGFDSLHWAEFVYYAPYLSGQQESAKTVFLNQLKKKILGEDAVPVKKIKLTRAYTFNQLFPNLSEQFVIKSDLTALTMQSFFERLECEVQSYFRNLKSQCVGQTGLLILFSDSEQYIGYPQKLEFEAYIKLVEELQIKEKIETILIKPHPRTRKKWLTQTISYLRQALPDTKFVIVEQYHYLPVEIIAGHFNLKACAGISSTSMRTIKEIYGLPVYFPQGLLEKLFETKPELLKTFLDWLEDVEGVFIPVAV